ncbi:dihydrodiol dehydrogenase, tandem duplicate 1 [Alosa alosa]|uniref:trans-1,2-dihydrobenzene-1,2-diol dehydrogenase-like n=1 Tax=Alosa sapidissima TaxID=34773 RepID=UPI001C093A61|nr:trans-1,2-dihydrobenzene-1,2-diol dehydrogenase-like [Alosa sapidissima]XP_048119272.1 dihydrodiol dehydrogenase, tandem duplicate 1 [Alosa alosa]
MATRWGICGAGKISHDWNVAMKTLPAEEHQVVAVAARSLERAQDFAKKHSIPKAYGSYEELAKDPNIDIVYLGVLHIQHLRVGLLFLNAGKNMLCEKPFAMNSREVKQLIDAAKKNNVFLMEGIWSRCFPVQREVSRLLAEEAVGEVKVVKAYFGSPQLHIPRSVEKELGGGALLDIGVYCLQFVLMVFQGERPESIHATGHRLESGVDEVMFVVLKFSRNRIGLCGFSIGVPLPNDATISGTKGSIRIPSPMWCPSALVVNGTETEYPLPEPCMPMNFTNSTGLRYEAQEVRQCLLKGLKESIRMPLADSALLAEVMDEARRQVGVVFSQDSQ